MAVIYKYKVEPKPELQTIEVPLGTKLVSAIEQNGEIMIYALLDDEYKSLGTTMLRIFVVGTGWELDLHSLFVTNFIGTVKSGSYVWHVFEVSDLPF